LVFFSEWARLNCRAFFFAGRSGAVQESQQGLTTIQAKTTENYCPRKRLPMPGNTGIFLASLTYCLTYSVHYRLRSSGRLLRSFAEIHTFYPVF
jgi:hypothetical protein